jgi:hypothetical protein
MREPKKPEDHLTPEERVFGVGYKRDADGMPVEAGIGSPSQPRANPTVAASSKPSDEQWTFLHRMVAAASPEIQRQFQEFLKYLKERERF